MNIYMWLIASFFYAYQYIIRVMPNIMIDDICQQFGIGAAAFGQFSGIYYIGYSLVHIPVGMTLDRIGPKKVMTGCILLTVAGLMPLIFAEHWSYPIIGRFLVGMGSSGAILGLFKIIRIAFSEERFARMLSISVTIGLLGAIYGGAPVSFMRDVFGYMNVIIGFAVGGLILACITYFIVPEIASSPTKSPMSDIKEVLFTPNVVKTCLFAGCMVGPLEGFADVWGSAYLHEVYGMSKTVSSSLLSLIFIGMCVGGPLLSFIAEKVKNYQFTIVGAGALMCAGSIAIAMKVPVEALPVCFIAIGIACAYQILAIYKASTYVREEVAGLTTAIANMIIMSFGYAIHSVIGIVAESTNSIKVAAIIIPIGLFIGTVGFTIAIRSRRSYELSK